MRNELETIEKIERYLSGGLSADEKTAFEHQLSADPALREQVRLQQEILSGIERAAWRERIGRAGTRYHFRQRFFKGGAWGLSALLLLTALTWWQLSVRHHNEPSPDVSTSAGQPSSANQTFLIDGSRDTIIETHAGIVFSIPAGSFLGADGRPATGPVQFKVREALDAASIIRSGLSTMSGDQLLETGGMFSIDAGKGGQLLKIDSTKGIYAEIPTDSVKPGMQLYSGKRRSDSSIDWTNPRPLDRDLVPVDILSLDFYPPNYPDSLRHWGHDSRNKTYTDSLYYSFAALFGKLDSVFGEAQILAPAATSDSIYVDTIHSPAIPFTLPSDCGINPAKIKAIWNKHFQHTLLATREFAERMPWIHRSHRNEILDLYVDHLDRPLSDIDSMAARMFKVKGSSGRFDAIETGGFREKFLSFYHRHDGRVANSPSYSRVAEYYHRKVQVYTEAIARTEKAFWEKQAALDAAAGQRTATRRADSVARVNENFKEELKVNVENVCRQLGYDPDGLLLPPAKAVYRVSLQTTGWYNIDRAIFESTLDRTTMQWKDDRTRRTAHIDYRPVSIEVAQSSSYDRVYGYLLPDRLSSFMRMSETNGQFTEKLNGSIGYTLVCLAYKKDQAFLAWQQDLQAGAHPPLTLNPIGQKDLDRQLKALGDGKLLAEVQKETIYVQQTLADQPRLQRNHELEQLRLRLMAMLFPCLIGEGGEVISPK